MKKKKLISELLLLLVAVIWGSAFVAQSKGTEYIGPFTYNFCRSVIGAAVLLPVIAVINLKRGTCHGSKSARRTTMAGGLWCGVVLCAASAFQQFGIGMTTAGKAGFITALYIVIVPVLGLLLHKRVPKLIWVCAAAAAGGFFLLCMKNGESFSVGSGELTVLCCAVLFSVHIMVIDHFAARGADGVKMSCIQFAVTAALSGILMLIFESPDIGMIKQAGGSVLYAGALSSGVGYTLQIIAQKHADPTAATLIMSLESVFAALSGWLILGETMSARELAGCGLVFAAVIAAQLAVPAGDDR